MRKSTGFWPENNLVAENISQHWSMQLINDLLLTFQGSTSLIASTLQMMPNLAMIGSY
jgi:hypothetical protein